ncbi:MAG: bifunctional folylpolyglutamate synthase/dihydrofolate synthase [Saprospiraceae bacterium]|nr:bifunctional folylpolyglutamate synthase/dihydrofolate synthase [Saprospiraceae bacterium]
MTYRETLDFLYAQLPMYHRVGASAFKKDLTNTIALCEHLGQPQRQFRSIHVGGTNGKGSVSHMLAAVCQSAGLRTGLYISPHYKDFRERIKVNGRYITQGCVVDFVRQHRDALERIQPSFFEMCVAMAFDHFAREKVDVAIIEVGLGGRLDSTNIITPLLSIITNISLDHINMLGDTLPAIAFEKAGIIKPGVPVLIGETHPESAPVFEKKAAECESPIAFADRHYQALEQDGGGLALTESTFDVLKNGQVFLRDLRVDAAGPYLSKNLATVVNATGLLRPELPGIGEQSLRTGLGQLRTLTRFIGRWQVIGQRPLILCDSAHNEAGLRLAFAQTEKMTAAMKDPETGRPASLHVVTGMVNDKDIDAVFRYFPAAARYYFAKARVPRGLEATILQEKASKWGLKGKAYVSVGNALAAARRAAGPEDMIAVIGSIFVVAEVLPPPR